MATAGQAAVKTFFERITKDIEIVRVALLLTGCIQVRNRVKGTGRGERRDARKRGRLERYQDTEESHVSSTVHVLDTRSVRLALLFRVSATR